MQLAARRKLRPPAPPRPDRAPERTLPIKVLQGAATQRTDGTRAGFARDTIFVTRKTKLGMLIRRARGLVMDEGYTHLTLYALGAAIPHALLLLHAVLDVLPFPSGPGGMWYEIATDTVACVDEVGGGVVGGSTGKFAGLGAIEEDETEYQTRNKSSIRIDIHIAPRAKSVHPSTIGKRKKDAKPRPGPRKRKSMQRAKEHQDEDHGEGLDEEDMMNG